MKLNKFFIFIFVFVFVLSFTSSIYTVSNPRLTTGGAFTAFGEIPYYVGFDETMCKEGQDFIVQIDPMGCSPAVVRSDLLEEEPVPIFCKLQAIKVNPIIDIEAFRTINIKGEYPPEVRTVGFYPSRAALGENVKLNNLMWDEIGYAVIYLDRQPNESAMPDFVEGNLTARITYDLANSFGIKYHSFYLPLLEDEEFNERMGQYAFFDKRGYLRAEDITQNSASISIYSGRYEAPFGKSRVGEIDRQRFGSYNLKEGEETGVIYLPGFGCYSGVKFKLEEIKISDTRAVLEINSEVYEVEKGEKFLDDKCSVVQVERTGISERTRIRCSTDEGSELFELSINPSLELEIGGEKGDYVVGQYLKQGKSGEYIYLAYANTIDDPDDEEKLRLVLISSNTFQGNYLDSKDVLAASYVFEGNKKISEGGSLLDSSGGSLVNLGTGIFRGNKYKEISYGQSEEYEGIIFNILGFGERENYPLSNSVEEGYESALEDFDSVISDYRQEKYPEGSLITLAEEAAYEKIRLAYSTNQRKDLGFFCDEFEEIFSDSQKDISICQDKVKISNTEVSVKDVLIKGDQKTISLQNVIQPTFKEYGAKILIGGIVNTSTNREMKISRDVSKNQIIPLNGNDYFRLLEVREDSVVIELFAENVTKVKQVQQAIDSREGTLRLNQVEKLGTEYSFILTEANVQKVAKVSVNPVTKNAGTTAEFEFRIGIEKRAIQLSPEKTKERIEKLDNTISTIDKITDGMEGVVEGLKAACIGTGAVLTAKNLVFGANGKTIARQEVMRGESGWYEECADLDYNGEKYKSVDLCLLDNADLIDGQVNEVTKVMNEQNKKIKELQEEFIQKGKLLEADTVNRDGLTLEYAKNAKEKILNSMEGVSLQKGSEDYDLKELLGVLDSEGYEAGVYTLEDLKELELYAELYQGSEDDQTKEIYRKRFITSLAGVEANSKTHRLIEAGKDVAENDFGISGMVPQIHGNEKAIESYYQGKVLPKNNKLGLEEGLPIQSIVYDNVLYYVILEPQAKNSNEFYIKEIYDKDYQRVDNLAQGSGIKSTFSKFVKYDSSTYRNSYVSNAKVRYYETEPYKGMPAVVPFDTKNGWYAYMRQTTSVLGNIESYHDSERISSFYLCNVGENGIEDFSEGREKDDVCQQINLNTGQPYSKFGGLEDSETSRLVNKAVRAIEDASRSHRSGGKTATILGETYSVGSPAVSSLFTECQDVMSPKDCQILYNVCDPVICPTSRCDFGGSYPVRDVIQSGVVGSVALCMPNFVGLGGDVYMPVCLTGVNEGLKSFNTVLLSYKDCLQESLDTGQTVGVCDEINSVYMCEFFWEQAMPLARIAVPKFIGTLTGESLRGGGEYLNIQSAFENAKESINFFSQSYALNSFNAFKARSQEQIGSEVCKNFISLSYPEGQGFFDVLTESDSPPQFNGNFDAIPFTTVTNPPMDHYKVYFHIYAGSDRGAYYKVYLRGGSGSSYYSDTFSGRNVASGYIPVGEYESQTVDFRAPSGYDELCIVVNDYEECGFKQVSTSFAKDYVKDQYILNQINNTNIRSEAECISGTTSLYTLLNPNLQEGVGDLLDPAVYNRGVIRLCATENPGKKNDPSYPSENQRWVEVGYCDQGLKCWMDTQSVKAALEFEYNEDLALDALSNEVLDKFQEAEGFMNDKEFESNLTWALNSSDKKEIVKRVNTIIDKVFKNNQRAKLFFERGFAWSAFAKEIHVRDLASRGDEDKIKDELIVTREKNVEDIVESFNFISPVYKFEDGRIGKNLCFRFFEGEWYWGDVCKEVEEKITTGFFTTTTPGTDFDWNKISTKKVSGLSERNNELVLSLYSKSYLEGIDVFLKKLESDKGNLFSNPSLIALNVGEVNHNGIYQFYDGTIEENIKFKFEKGQWFWGFPGSLKEELAWVECSILQHPILKGSSLNEQERLIVSHLNNQESELKGAAIILGGDLVKSSLGNIVYEKINEGDDLCPDKCLSSYTLGKNGKYNSSSKSCKYQEFSCESYCDFENNECELKEVEDEKPVPVVDGIPSGETCEIINPDEALSVLTDPRQRVLQSARSLEGKYSYIGKDGCYDAANYIYEIAGVKSSCVYSDKDGKIYSSVGIDTTSNPSWTDGSSVYKVNPSTCKGIGIDLDENKKLNGLQPGDMISYYSGREGSTSDSPHNAIFVGWIDEESRLARLFDWNGQSFNVGDVNSKNQECEGEWIKTLESGARYCKTYRYFSEYLTDDKHPVYLYWAPRN